MRDDNPPSPSSQHSDTHSERSSPHVDGESVETLAHDLRGFLHVVKTSLYVLRASRENETQFNEILDIIDTDQVVALEKLSQLVALAKHSSTKTEQPAPEQT